MKKILLTVIPAILFMFCLQTANGKDNYLPVVSPAESDEPGLIKIVPVNEEEYVPIPLPDFKPIINFKSGKSNTNRTQGTEKPLANLSASETLFLNQHMAFRINTGTKTIEFIPPVYTLNPLCQQALDISPAWLRSDLKIKFRELAAKGFDDEYAQLILDAAAISHDIVDETAFQVAYTSVAALTDSRFDKRDMLIRNAQFIYTTKDSLKYVRLKEYGTYESGDFYTTAEYKIKDGADGEVKWVEIPREYYYWYVVHPKIYQEGVYEKDNTASTQQRTYGYFWRDYLWKNPVPAYDYTQVNKTTSKGTVSTIPRLGNIMQKPEILWDRQQTYYDFNRPFNDGDDALNVIGNWASKGIPVDAKDNRPIQPNQTLYEHNGNCGEDAYLVAAACRTALIPIIHLNTSCEDHAFGAIWDEDWQHFEFFRGGLAESGNQFYGITNLLWGGSYGWTTSMVEGTRPDGYIMNHTKYYAKDLATIELTILDEAGAPVDGANVTMYAAPYAYGTGPVISGNTWTDSEGKVALTVGAGKSYYFKISHPKLGTLPEGNQIYVITQAPAVKGQVYKGISYFTNSGMPKIKSDVVLTPDTSDFGFRIKLNNKEIITSINTGDAQQEKFYYRPGSSNSAIGFFVCNQENYDKYLKGEKFESYGRIDRCFDDELNFGLPKGGDTWYVVLTNETAVTNYKDLTIDALLYESFKDVPHLNPPLLKSPADAAIDMDKSLKLEWNSVAGAKNYRIEVSTDRIFTQLAIQSKDIDALYYDISGLKDNTEYFWRARAVNEFSESQWSETWLFKTRPPKVLAAPVLNEPPDIAVNVSPDVILKWSPVTEAKDYHIQLSEKLFFTTTIISDTVKTTEYPLSGLEIGKKYYWRVRINDGIDNGPWAKAYSFTVGTGSSVNDNNLSKTDLKLLSVMPNPVNDSRVSLFIESAKDSRGKLNIINSIGELLFVLEIPIVAGNNEYIFMLPTSMSTGVYHVIIESESNRAISKMIKL